MSRVIHVFRTPDRFVAGTVGEPGDRTFYLQAVDDAKVISVLLEKEQVAVLAERLSSLLDEVARRFGADVPPDSGEFGDTEPLTTPVEQEFRVGTMGLGWDAESKAIVVELLAVTEDEVDESVVLDDTEEGPDAVRVFLSPEQARAFTARAERVVSAGRRPCPLCAEPLEPGGAHLSEAERLSPPDRDLSGPKVLPTDSAALPLLHDGRIEVASRIVDASNATLFCTVHCEGVSTDAVYKPIRGERPLWDFPDGTLAGREVASWLLSEATGWSLVPPTVLRPGPLGPGMVQLWVDTEHERDLVDVVAPDQVPRGWRRVLRAHDRYGDPALLVHADTEGLRRLAVLDVLLNNADRKGGHVLAGLDGEVYGVDHGICLHHEDKLRTVLWGFLGEPLPAGAPVVLRRVRADLDSRLGVALSEHLTRRELQALRTRTDQLLATETFPAPNGTWPAIPWPAF